MKEAAFGWEEESVGVHRHVEKSVSLEKVLRCSRIGRSSLAEGLGVSVVLLVVRRTARLQGRMHEMMKVGS